MREILVDWTTPAGGGKVSVFYFGEATAASAQRAALGTMLGTIDAEMTNDVTWRVRTDGRMVDEATGQLTSLWSESTAQNGTGASPLPSLPDASQVLVRWLTSSVVSGRLVRGRTFLPGLTANTLSDGNVGSSLVTIITNAAQALVAANVGLGVWHRPGPSGPGQLLPVTSAGCWNEYAVLRRRRG